MLSQCDKSMQMILGAHMDKIEEARALESAIGSFALFTIAMIAVSLFLRMKKPSEQKLRLHGIFSDYSKVIYPGRIHP